jgi:hypothetical protein
MVSNPLDPDLMTAPERLSEVASLLARGILRHRLRTADGRKPALSVCPERSRGGVEGKPLDVLAVPRDECVETRSEVETHE